MNSILEPTNWPEGIKKTKQRVGIWQVLSQAQKPITAAEIATGLGEDGGINSVWMSTIYRTLDFFVEKQGKISMENGKICSQIGIIFCQNDGQFPNAPYSPSLDDHWDKCKAFAC